MIVEETIFWSIAWQHWAYRASISMESVMSKKSFVKLAVLAAATVAILDVGAASARGFGQGPFGRGDIHFDHIVVHGGHDGGWSHGGYGHGGYGHGDDPRGGGRGASRGGRAGNTGVYCQFCVGQRTPAPLPDPTENHKG